MLHTVLGPYVGEASRLLDVGSADGPSVGWLSAPHKVSLDLDPRGLRPPGGVCGSLLALPFADASFEVVGAFDVIEHCEPEADALRELHRVLEPGGRLLVSVPAYQWAWSDHDVANGHHRRYTRRRAVAALQGAGFEVRRATYGFAGVFPMFVAERLVRAGRHRLARRTDRPADVVDVPRVGATLERALLGLCRLDERVLARRDLPFGSSVFLAAVKS
jgi:SAM-dependent methyltransferase